MELARESLLFAEAENPALTPMRPFSPERSLTAARWWTRSWRSERTRELSAAWPIAEDVSLTKGLRTHLLVEAAGELHSAYDARLSSAGAGRGVVIGKTNCELVRHGSSE